MDVQAGGYSGSESYKYVDPILRDSARELLVISPYIGMGYAKMLVGLGKKKSVKVITSSYSEQVRNYILNRSRHVLYGYAEAAAAFLFGSFVAVYFSFYQIALGAFALTGVITLVALISYKLSKSSDIEIRTSYDRFVHEKAYISKGAAAVGSANLTYNGMHKNVERVEVITDPSRIGVLRSHFFDLWRVSR